jgi:hypothetical protein
MSTRPQKITFAEMSSSGVRRLLIYCADYHCSHYIAISGDRVRMMFGCLILSRDLSARLAASEVPTCGRISSGTGQQPSEGVSR